MKVEQLHPTSQDSKRNEIVEVAMNFFGMHRTSEKVFFFPLFPPLSTYLPSPLPFFFPPVPRSVDRNLLPRFLS